MSRFWIIFHFVAYLILVTLTTYWGVGAYGESSLGLFIGFSTEYLLVYLFYLVVNRVQIYIKKGKFEDRLFVMPLLLIPACYLHGNIVYGMYESIDREFFTYVRVENDRDVSCLDAENCMVIYGDDSVHPVGTMKHGGSLLLDESIEKEYRVLGRIVLRKYISKIYLVTYKGSCLRIESPSYAPVKMRSLVFGECAA